MHTKEEITAAARKRFRTEEADIGGGVKLTLRELTHSERTALDGRLWVTAPDGTLAKDAQGFHTLNAGVHYNEEWIAAACAPAFTVGDLLSDDWPESLKEELKLKVQKLCGLTIKEATKN